MNKLIFMTSLVLLGACGFAGCDDEAPPPKTAADVPKKTQQTHYTPKQDQALDKAQEQTGGGGLGIEDQILKLCPAVKPPRFGYDSARVKREFREALRALATCMNEGGLKGRELLLVGHADPRGEDDYNMALGGRRAEAVRSALESLGVDSGRLEVTSRGELDATGTDERGWAKDRRVDIKLKK